MKKLKITRSSIIRTLSQQLKRVTFITSLFRSDNLRRLRTLLSLSPVTVVYLMVFGSYVVDLFFTLFELDPTTMKHYHPFYYGETFSNGFVWNGYKTDTQFIHAFMGIASRAMIFLAAWVAVMNNIPVKIFIWCMWVELADGLDYWLTNNDHWVFIPKLTIYFGSFTLENWEFEMNYIKVFLMAYLSYKGWKKHRLASPLSSV